MDEEDVKRIFHEHIDRQIDAIQQNRRASDEIPTDSPKPEQKIFGVAPGEWVRWLVGAAAGFLMLYVSLVVAPLEDSVEELKRFKEDFIDKESKHHARMVGVEATIKYMQQDHIKMSNRADKLEHELNAVKRELKENERQHHTHPTP